MRFEESVLTGFLLRNLQPLTEADPVILAEYVAALLKKDKPIKELEKLCTEDLSEFLGEGTRPFINKLFLALEEGSLVAPSNGFDIIGHVEASHSHTAEDHLEMQNSVEKLEGLSSGSDGEQKDVTDDEDADRNHKHRRRESQQHSFEDGKHNGQEQLVRRTSRKRPRLFDSAQIDPQSSESRKESDSFRRNFYGNVGKRRLGVAPHSRALFGGPSIDSQPLGRPLMGRGRGRIPSSWGQHDSKFSSAGTPDLGLQIMPLGATPPSLFAGRGLQPFGLIRGMPNGGLDPFYHPFGLQGPLGPPVNQSLSIGNPRQPCRDFEELGYCLSGDMCPMEHGINRIVVEDVQSLSKFNLPVSIPGGRLLETSSETGHVPSSGAPSSLLTNGIPMLSKNCKPGNSQGENDFYDPDQPLWNNDHGEMPRSLMGFSSPSKVDDSDPFWNSNPFDSSQSTSANVRGRRDRDSGKFDGKNASTGYVGDEVKEDQKAKNQVSSQDVDPISVRHVAATRHNTGRTSTRASCTLFVNGVPLKNNRKDILLSHFQKFGKIIDVYIPANSEKAFVQFSSREEAEAALRAPDAVMGNRFIRLWWANRDNISNTTSYFPSQSSIADKGKENFPLVTSKATAVSKASASPMSTSVSLGLIGANGPKAKPSSQNKLELLKEEIRLKQEMLDQKANDFRQRLAKLEKQGIASKDEVSMGQFATKLEGDTIPETAQAKTLKSINPDAMIAKFIPVENIMSPSSRKNLTIGDKSPNISKQASYPSTMFGASYPTNRFKLDNRPTSFTVHPPLPAGLANVNMLKKHFSSFGELSAVELDGSKANVDPAGVTEQTKDCSAHITFVTRRSAERAISNGICWQGHTLQFSWLRSSNNSCTNGHVGGEKSSIPMPQSNSSDANGDDTAAPISTGNGVVEKFEEVQSSDITEAARSPCKTLSPTG